MIQDYKDQRGRQNSLVRIAIDSKRYRQGEMMEGQGPDDAQIPRKTVTSCSAETWTSGSMEISQTG